MTEKKPKKQLQRVAKSKPGWAPSGDDPMGMAGTASQATLDDPGKSVYIRRRAPPTPEAALKWLSDDVERQLTPLRKADDSTPLSVARVARTAMGAMEGAKKMLDSFPPECRDAAINLLLSAWRGGEAATVARLRDKVMPYAITGQKSHKHQANRRKTLKEETQKRHPHDKVVFAGVELLLNAAAAKGKKPNLSQIMRKVLDTAGLDLNTNEFKAIYARYLRRTKRFYAF